MNEIEQKFFETFEIPKSRRLWTVKEGFKEYYPEITDRILIELMKIILNYNNSVFITITNRNIKEDVLEALIYISYRPSEIATDVKRQVQALLKEE